LQPRRLAWPSANRDHASEGVITPKIMPSEQVVGRLNNMPALPATARTQTAESSVSQDHLHDTRRIVPLDNLKAVLVAWVIAGHAFLGYAAVGGWPYDEVAETTLPRQVELGLEIIIGPTALFVIGTFFFLSGLLAPQGIARHGPAGFIRQRVLRLGLPWLLFTLTVWPFVMWIAHRSAGHQISFWQALETRRPLLDSGPLWFVQILLYVSVVHALVTWAGQHYAVRPRAITLVMTAVVIAATSFAVRMWYPARSQQVLDLHVWQWPQCIGLYALGVLIADQGWAQRVPLRTARRCGMAVLAAVAVGVAVIALFGLTDFKRDDVPFLGGWHWQALGLDAVEATLVVAGSVWLLGWAQRWLTSRRVRLTRVARSAYAAYLLQAPVLIGLEVAARSFEWPAVVKGVLIAGFAVTMSFGLGWFITHHLPSSRIE
jgi:hypothetical protein